MAYKFPWTNYHELNLDWILNTVKELFSKTEQNNAIVEQYDGRLTEVELTADNAQTAAEQAQQNSTAALDLAQGAQTTATQAQQAAGQAQQAAGQAQTAAGQALEAAATAQQTATQAQQTAQNFDGRIRQAEDNASSALQAAQAFDEQVQGAITAANNANEAATAALTTSAETARELAAQRDTLEDIIENAAQSLEVDLSTKADVIINTAEGEIASFNDGADDMPIKKLVVNIEPVQSGSGDPSPTNVRPISGWTGAEVTQTGKNLFFADNSVSGYLNSDGDLVSTSDWRVSDYIPIKGGLDYYCQTGSGAGSNPRSIIYNANKEMIATVRTGNRLISVPDSGCYIRMSYRTTDVDIQLELGSTPTAYEPYTGRIIPISWETEAGIIYGGSLDVISGSLNSNMAKIVLDGTQAATIYNWRPTEGSVGAVFPFNLTNNVVLMSDALVPNALSDKLKTVSYSDAFNGRADACVSFIADASGGSSYGIVIRINDPSLNTAVLMNAYLAQNPIEIVYELATPVEYQLTPQQVKTLYQYNNIWSDAGSVNVEYPADTKTYIDNKFAELQALILEH